MRLNHVHPDGASTRITYGVLNLAHREDATFPYALPLGTEVEVTVTLDHIAYQLPAGHQLRLAISNAYWPLIWPSPAKAKLELTGGHIDLPVRAQADADERTFPPPDADPAWAITTLREGNHVRRSETDHQTGTVTLIIEDDFGKQQDLSHGLISGSIARERWSIHPDDPLSARGSCHWTNELERDDIRMRDETYSEMWSDHEHFYLTARLEAYENDVLVFEKAEDHKIKRDNL